MNEPSRRRSKRLQGLKPNKLNTVNEHNKRKTASTRLSQKSRRQRNTVSHIKDGVPDIVKSGLGGVAGMMVTYPIWSGMGMGAHKINSTQMQPYIPFNGKGINNRMYKKRLTNQHLANNTGYYTVCNDNNNPQSCSLFHLNNKGGIIEPKVIRNIRNSRVNRTRDTKARALRGDPLYDQFVFVHIPNGFIETNYTTYTVPLNSDLIMHAGVGNTVRYENGLKNGNNIFQRYKAKLMKNELPKMASSHLVHNGGEPIVNTVFNNFSTNSVVKVYNFKNNTTTNITNKVLNKPTGSLKSIMSNINRMYKGSKKLVVFTGSRQVRIPQSRKLLHPGNMPNNTVLRRRTMGVGKNGNIFEKSNRQSVLNHAKKTFNKPTHESIFSTRERTIQNGSTLEKTFTAGQTVGKMHDLYKSQKGGINTNRFIPHAQIYNKIIMILAHGAIPVNAKTYKLPNKVDAFMLSKLGSSTLPNNICFASTKQFNHMKIRVDAKKPIFNKSALDKGAFISGGQNMVDTNLSFVPQTGEKIFVKVLDLHNSNKKHREEDITNKLVSNRNNVTSFSKVIKGVGAMYPNERLLFIIDACRPFSHKGLNQLFPHTFMYGGQYGNSNTIKTGHNYSSSKRTSTRGWLPRFIDPSGGVNKATYNKSIEDVSQLMGIENKSIINSNKTWI